MTLPKLNSYILYKNSFIDLKKKVKLHAISDEEAQEQAYAMYVNLKAIIDYNELVCSSYIVLEYNTLLAELKEFINKLKIACETQKTR